MLCLSPLPAGDVLRLLGDPAVELVLPEERTQAAVDALLPEVDLVVGDWTHTLRVGDPGPRLALVQQPSVGVDVVDLDACAAREVPVANCAGANATSVAEWCVAATLALLRGTVPSDAAVRRGEWPAVRGRELAGLSVGVVGMGAIGRVLAPLLTAFGCDVAYWSRTPKPDAPAPYADLDDLVAGSDVLVLVIALGPETRGMLGVERLARCKPGQLVVNGARGPLLDEAALADALHSGHLGGAALDTYAVEPLPADSPLRGAPGVLLSPHLAGTTVEASTRVLAMTAANLQRALSGDPMIDVVNDVDPTVRWRTGAPGS